MYRYTLVRSLACLVGLLFVAAVPGCGQGEHEMTDADYVSSLIGNVGEAADEAETFKAFFLDRVAPEDSQRARYRRCSFDTVAGSLSASGDSASATVIVREISSGEILGEIEWTAEKVGDQWKLKSAPMPGAK